MLVAGPISLIGECHEAWQAIHGLLSGLTQSLPWPLLLSEELPLTHFTHKMPVQLPLNPFVAGLCSIPWPFRALMYPWMLAVAAAAILGWVGNTSMLTRPRGVK